jgi:hypothetical protein
MARKSEVSTLDRLWCTVPEVKSCRRDYLIRVRIKGVLSSSRQVRNTPLSYYYCLADNTFFS